MGKYTNMREIQCIGAKALLQMYYHSTQQWLELQAHEGEDDAFHALHLELQPLPQVGWGTLPISVLASPWLRLAPQ